MSIYNINRPNESRDSNLNLSTILQENDIYTYEQNQICMIYSEDSTLDMINFTEGIHVSSPLPVDRLETHVQGSPAGVHLHLPLGSSSQTSYFRLCASTNRFLRMSTKRVSIL